jgi:hypothetical protein
VGQRNNLPKSIFVEYDAIDHHGIAFAGKPHMHRDTNLDWGPNDVWIEHCSALGYVDYLFAETIGAWSAALLEIFRNGSDRGAELSLVWRGGVVDGDQWLDLTH